MTTKHIYKTKQEVVITGYYGGGSPHAPYDPFTIPAGTRCQQVTHGGGRIGFYLDEFPANLFPGGSCIRHDVTHYGVHIPDEAVEDVTPAPIDLPSGKNMSPSSLALTMDVMRCTALIPYATERRGWIWVTMHYRMDGTYVVTRKHEEAPLAQQPETLYDGPSSVDAHNAWVNA